MPNRTPAHRRLPPRAHRCRRQGRGGGHGAIIIYLALGIGASPAVEESSSAWTFAPVEAAYPPYLADPRRPTTSASHMVSWSSDLNERFDTGSNRFDLRIGERFEAVERRDGDRIWQFSIGAGFFGLFDQEHQLDSIGWDGWYAGHLSLRWAEPWAAKFSYRHLSSHLGDEFIERTGRERIRYTREDVTLALAWTSEPGWTIYGELGSATHLSAGADGRGYAQAGWQWHRPNPTIWNRFGWSTAIDLQSFEGDDWEPNLTAEAMLILPDRQGRDRLRAGFVFHHGRVPVGELHRFRESSLSFRIGWEP